MSSVQVLQSQFIPTDTEQHGALNDSKNLTQAIWDPMDQYNWPPMPSSSENENKMSWFQGDGVLDGPSLFWDINWTPPQQDVAPENTLISPNYQLPSPSSSQKPIPAETSKKPTREKQLRPRMDSTTKGNRRKPTNEDNTNVPEAKKASQKRIQESNRKAASRFRVRKREGEERLRSKEQEREDTHRRLSNSVDELMDEVYELKMKLLLHSNCNCSLIQNYIKDEAQNYVEGIEQGLAGDAKDE